MFAVIAAQPFLLRARVGARARRHVPDFLLVHADESVSGARGRVGLKTAAAGPGRRCRQAGGAVAGILAA
jgi:hypothetical protein